MSKNLGKNEETVVVDSDYPLDHVPLNKRKTAFSVMAVFLGITFFTPTMAAGAQIANAFKFSTFAWIMLLGNLILGVYVAVNCMIGAETGLTSVLLSKYTLGSVGAKWSGIILGGTQVGWYAVVCSYVGSMYAIALNNPSLEIPFTIFWAIVFGVTAIWGYSAMEKVAYVAIPGLLFLVFYVPVIVIRDVGGLAGLNAILPTTEMTLATAVTVIVGTFSSMGTQACNWSRFSKSSKAAFGAGFVAFMIGNSLMLFTGAIGALGYGESDFIVVLMNLGITLIAVVIMTLNIWTTAHAGAYSFGVAGSEFFGKTKKTPFVIGGVVIATILASTGIYSQLIPYLNLLGIFVPPLGGAIIGDYYLTYKRKLPRLEYVEFKKVRIAPVAAYLIGTIAALLTERFGIGIPPLIGIVVAIICAPIATAILNKLNINDMHNFKENFVYVEHPGK